MDGERLALKSKDTGGNSLPGLLYTAGGREGVSGMGRMVRSVGTCTGRAREKKNHKKRQREIQFTNI